MKTIKFTWTAENPLLVYEASIIFRTPWNLLASVSELISVGLNEATWNKYSIRIKLKLKIINIKT